MTLVFSRRLAIAAGLLLPPLETVRRWHQLGDVRVWPFWLDDCAIGLLLLHSAWRTRRDRKGGHPFLAAAWGVACGMGYGSFFSQLASADQADPSGISSTVVVAMKGAMLALAVTALVGTLRWKATAIID